METLLVIFHRHFWPRRRSALQGHSEKQNIQSSDQGHNMFNWLGVFQICMKPGLLLVLRISF